MNLLILTSKQKILIEMSNGIVVKAEDTGWIFKSLKECLKIIRFRYGKTAKIISLPTKKS